MVSLTLTLLPPRWMLQLACSVVKATRKSWDYVVTSSLTHLVLCIIGEQA